MHLVHECDMRAPIARTFSAIRRICGKGEPSTAWTYGQETMEVLRLASLKSKHVEIVRPNLHHVATLV